MRAKRLNDGKFFRNTIEKKRHGQGTGRNQSVSGTGVHCRGNHRDFKHCDTGSYDVETDFQNTLKQCRKMTLQDCKEYNKLYKLLGQVLRLIAPLM